MTSLEEVNMAFVKQGPDQCQMTAVHCQNQSCRNEFLNLGFKVF